MKWLGHACFYLTSPQGVRVLTDPFDPGVPYPPISVECDVVTVSHEHSDHYGLKGVKGSPKLLLGLDKDTEAVKKIQETVGDVSFRTVASNHDEQGGSKRGRNAIFVMDFSGLKIVHLGDLGHELSDGAVQEIGQCDVLLIPVGGFYTIGGTAAAKVAGSLSPRVVVPMHYKTQYIASWSISGPEEFLATQKAVRNVGKGEVALDKWALPVKPEVWVFAV
jgi:L-ascorbate metabolism protein UlaG (beta-lactamase superfamily)